MSTVTATKIMHTVSVQRAGKPDIFYRFDTRREADSFILRCYLGMDGASITVRKTEPGVTVYTRTHPGHADVILRCENR